MLVVAGMSYTVEAADEEEAETKLLELLSDFYPTNDACAILKIWVSARQNSNDRVADLDHKEREALADA